MYALIHNIPKIFPFPKLYGNIYKVRIREWDGCVVIIDGEYGEVISLNKEECIMHESKEYLENLRCLL